MKKENISLKVIQKRIVLCVIMIIAFISVIVWNFARKVHAYEISYDTSSKTYSKGYFDVVIDGPNGNERMNLEVNYSGKQMTQSQFIKSAQSVTLNRKSGEKAGTYSASLVTTSAKTEKDDDGNYTRIKFQFKYKQPAHQYTSISSNGEFIKEINNMDCGDFMDISGNKNTEHSTSAHDVTLTAYISIYTCGICNYEQNSKYLKIWNSELQLDVYNTDNYVNYQGNGGSVLQNGSYFTTISEPYICGEKFADIPTKGKRNGYTFTGWKDTEDASGTSYTASSSVCNKNINLYAQWKANQYKIHYDANGGSGTMNDSTVTYDSSFTLPQNQLTKDGYRFLGWSKTKDGTVSYGDQEKFTYQTASDITLYAVWGKGQYVISFLPNGAEGDLKTTTVNVGEETSLMKNVYKRDGYAFLGWNTDPNAVNPFYSDGQKVIDLTDAEKTVKLYAVWKKSDGNFNTSNIIHDEDMFTGDIEIQGGNGTGYDSGHTDSGYARIDQDDTPGYFTKR